MRRYNTLRGALLLSTVLLSGSLSACGLAPAITSVHKIDVKEETSTTKELNGSEFDKSSEELDIANNDDTSEETPESYNTPLNIRGATIYLGENKDSLIKKLGFPNRIDETEYDFEYYIYNNDYNNLLFIAMKDDKAVGYYTDSINFNLMGITTGADIKTVNQVLSESYELKSVLVHTTDLYVLHILLDSIDTKKVTGIYLLSSDAKEDEYSDEVKRNIEQMVYDLTNSIRVRKGQKALSWSSSAALAARKHSSNMAENHFFNHKDSTGRSPGDRLKSEGIAYQSSGENIIAGYGTAILSTHGWYNSSGHRKNILSTKFRYLGVGFDYLEDSDYKTYITQNFFR